MADPFALRRLELEQRDLRWGLAAPTLPCNCLNDLADALHCQQPSTLMAPYRIPMRIL
jgi:hypothetical protein